jgi:DNA replication and repair protein RecF
LFLKSIHLTNFKNHEKLEFTFSKKVNCFIGNNGVGKTNILDAIHYMCLTKSYFNSTDQQNIRFTHDFMRLEAGTSIGNDAYNIVCKLPAGKKKDFSVNEIAYRKMSDHIGLMPVVMIAPDDNQLIIGNSEERRKFIDNTISQVDREYLEHLILYNKYLEQRNALLKNINTTGHKDELLLETIMKTWPGMAPQYIKKGKQYSRNWNLSSLITIL